MLFKPFHIPMIRSGLKVETRRLWKRWHVREGGTYPAQDKFCKPRIECPIIRCVARYQQRLGDMTEENAKMEGGYTLEQFQGTFKAITGKWDSHLVVYVVRFEYIGEGEDIYG